MFDQQKISRFTRRELLRLWKSIEANDTPAWKAGKAFEYLVLRAFELEGAEVRWPYRVELGGEEIEQIDGVIYSDGLACLIECKDSVEKTKVEPIAKLRNQLLRRPVATLGIVFSRGGFTEPAQILTRFVAPQTILLWTGGEVEFALRRKSMRQGLLEKYRHCIENGNVYHDLTQGSKP
jgi:hypothetical protein